MFKKKFLPALVTGFSLAVISIIPLLQIGTCCLFAPIAGIVAITLFHMQIKNLAEFQLKRSDGISIGIMVGIIAGFFESIFQSLLIFVSKTNPVNDAIIFIQQNFNNLPIPDILNEISKEIDEKRFSLLLSLSIFFNASIIYSIFASIGGVIGVSGIKRRNQII